VRISFSTVAHMTRVSAGSQADLARRLVNVDLNLLPPLLALLQEGSVTRAAERVGLSQPAMSHTLARLRALLGDEILVRSGNRSTLTPRAHGLIQVVSRLLADVSENVLDVRAFDPSRDARRFGLSMSTSTAFVVAPVLLEVGEGNAPNVTFELFDNPEPGDDVFARPEVDVALLADTVPTGYPREPLYLDRWVGVASKDHPQIGRSLTLEHLISMPHIAYQSPTARTAPYVVLSGLGIHPTFDMVTTNFLLTPLLVAGTRRIAIVQERLAAGLSPHAGIRTLELPVDVPPLRIDLIWNPRIHGDPGVAWLRNCLLLHPQFTR